MKLLTELVLTFVQIAFTRAPILKITVGRSPENFVFTTAMFLRHANRRKATKSREHSASGPEKCTARQVRRSEFSFRQTVCMRV